METAYYVIEDFNDNLLQQIFRLVDWAHIILYWAIACWNLIAFNSYFSQLHLVLFMGHALIIIYNNTTLHACVDILDLLCTKYSFEKKSMSQDHPHP